MENTNFILELDHLAGLDWKELPSLLALELAPESDLSVAENEASVSLTSLKFKFAYRFTF